MVKPGKCFLYHQEQEKVPFFSLFLLVSCIVPDGISQQEDKWKVQIMKRKQAQNFHRWYDHQQTQSNSQNQNNSEDHHKKFVKFLDTKSVYRYQIRIPIS